MSLAHLKCMEFTQLTLKNVIYIALHVLFISFAAPWGYDFSFYCIINFY